MHTGSPSTDDFAELSRLLQEARTDSSTDNAVADKTASEAGFTVTAGENSNSQRGNDNGRLRSWQPPTSRTLSASAVPFVVKSFAATAPAGLFSTPSAAAAVPALPGLHGQPLHTNARAPLWQVHDSSAPVVMQSVVPTTLGVPLPVQQQQSVADCLVPFLNSAHHIAMVQNLEPRTTKKQLFDIFFPMGAVDAAVLIPSGVPIRRGVGVVMFSSSEMAKIAAEKLHDFVPHGQSFPLVVTYVPRPAGMSSGAASSLHPSSSADAPQTHPFNPMGLPTPSPRGFDPVPSSSTISSVAAFSEAFHRPHRDVVESAPLSAAQAAAATDNVSFLQALSHCVAKSVVSADDLGTILVALVRRPQSTRTLVEDSVKILREQIVSMGAHSFIFTPPLAGALHHMVSDLEAQTERNGNPLNRAQVDLYTFFKRCFSQALLQLLLDRAAERGSRSVAGVLIGHLFNVNFLAGTPFGMSRKLMETHEAAMLPARQYLKRIAGSSCTPSSTDVGVDLHRDAADEQQHAPWINLVEALECMTSSWVARNPDRVVDENEMEFGRLIKRFYHSEDSGSAHGTPSSHDEPVAKRTPPPTPSARPTPTSAVVSRVSPVKPVATSFRPGVNVNAVAQHTPRSECGATPLDSSLESNSSEVHVAPLAFSSHTTAPAMWQQPVIRIAAGAKVAASVSTPGTATPASTATAGGVTSSNTSLATAVTALPVTYEMTLQKDLLASTVYLTKLPGGLTDAKLRRLIAYFGEFNKVRMYKEKTPPAIRNSSGGAFQHQNRGCFGFVEYAQCASAKTMIDYFRNASMTSSNPFHFLIGGDLSTQFSPEEIRLLAQTRASYAKSAIHDQHPRDAVFEPAPGVPSGPNIKVQPCIFGLPGDLPSASTSSHAPPAAVVGLPFATFPPPSPSQAKPATSAPLLFSDTAHFPSRPGGVATHVDVFSLAAVSNKPVPANLLERESGVRLGGLGLDTSGTW